MTKTCQWKMWHDPSISQHAIIRAQISSQRNVLTIPINWVVTWSVFSAILWSIDQMFDSVSDVTPFGCPADVELTFSHDSLLSATNNSQLPLFAVIPSMDMANFENSNPSYRSKLRRFPSKFASILATCALIWYSKIEKPVWWCSSLFPHYVDF